MIYSHFGSASFIVEKMKEKKMVAGQDSYLRLLPESTTGKPLEKESEA